MLRVVIDTNVYVSAVLSRRSNRERQVLRLALDEQIHPVFGEALYFEYEDVSNRADLWKNCTVSEDDRYQLRAALYAVSEWVQIYYLWRPNLIDEADNHLWELALAGGADAIISSNTRHLVSGELKFPNVKVMTPAQFIKEAPWQR